MLPQIDLPENTQKSAPQTTSKFNPVRWVKEHWVTAAIVLPAVTTIGLLSNLTTVYDFADQHILSDWQIHKAKGEILTPADSSFVPEKVSFEGKISKIPKGSSLWLIIYGSGIQKYYPYEIIDPDLESGKWRYRDIEIGVPTDSKRKFKAELFLVSKDDSEVFQRRVRMRARRAEQWKRYKQSGLDMKNPTPYIKEHGSETEGSIPVVKERGFEAKPPGKSLDVVDIMRS
jgi:hypothetical protein